MFCPMCGVPNEDEAVFCGNCGAALNPDEAQAEAPRDAGQELLEGEQPDPDEGPGPGPVEAADLALDDAIASSEEAFEEAEVRVEELDVEDASVDIPPVEEWEAAVPPVPAPAPSPPSPPSVPMTQSIPSSGLAIASLVLGICGLTILPLLASILAIIFGYMARRDIRQRPDEVSGEGMAMAGIVMGWIAVGLAVAGLLLFGGITACGICSAFGSAGTY